MAKISWTREAERWLKDIFDFISVENPEAENSVVVGIYTKSQILKEFPQIGYTYKHESTRNIRILLYGHYRIAYEITDAHAFCIVSVR